MNRNGRLYHFVFVSILVSISFSHSRAQDNTDSLKLEKMRSESGIDPTRIMSRIGYTMLIYDKAGPAGRIVNRISAGIGVNKLSFSAKIENIVLTPASPGEGFQSGFGDIGFSVLGSFYSRGRSALAGAVDFSVPTGKPGFGSQYFSSSLALTFSYTLRPGLFLAVQPEYEFDLMKDPLSSELSVLTIRSFIAKFTGKGYYFVFEPRPVFDLENSEFDLILSPVVGKAIGTGFNMVLLAEFPVKSSTYYTTGALYRFGFSRSF